MFAANFDAALEQGAVFDHDARGVNVASDAARRTQHDAVASAQIALDISAHNNFARFDVGLHVAVRADGYACLVQMNGAQDLAINRDFAPARQIAFDANAAREQGVIGRRARRSQ